MIALVDPFYEPWRTAAELTDPDDYERRQFEAEFGPSWDGWDDPDCAAEELDQ